MLSLDSPKWSELSHAYGKASDIPELLRQLANLPTSVGSNEPWFSIWSALAHQGDVYPASFAAVPHVVAALSRAPAEADEAFFHFPAWVEVCRLKSGAVVPDELAASYNEALSKLPSLVAAASNRPWSDSMLMSALGAIAAAKGFGSVAEAALELNPEVADDFLEWFFSR